MIKQMQSFPFNPPVNFSEEGKWLLAVTSFEPTNPLFNISKENNSFSISILFYWKILNYLEGDIVDKLNNLLKLKSQNDIEEHVQEVRRIRNKIKKIPENFIMRFQ